MKKFLALVLCACLLSAALPALAGDDPTYYAVVNNPNPADRLNLRRTPSRDAASDGKYYNGVIVRVLQDNGDGWAQVRIGDVLGYMMTDYLADPTQVSVPSATLTGSVNCSWGGAVWLQDSPHQVSTPLVPLPNGTPVVVLGIADKFAHVQTQGITGFLLLDSLSLPAVETDTPAVEISSLPAPLTGDLQSAALTVQGSTVTLSDPAKLRTLSGLLSSREYWGYGMAGCPFGAALTLTYTDGSVRMVELAMDSCAVYRENGHDFKYARFLKTEDSGVDNAVLYDLFGVKLF